MENTENQITIADLDVLRNILDLAASRGAFRAAELEQVGVLYNKLTSFLEAAVAAQTQTTDSESHASVNPQSPQGE
jgi:hypothetical protein